MELQVLSYFLFFLAGVCVGVIIGAVWKGELDMAFGPKDHVETKKAFETHITDHLRTLLTRKGYDDEKWYGTTSPTPLDSKSDHHPRV